MLGNQTKFLHRQDQALPHHPGGRGKTLPPVIGNPRLGELAGSLSSIGGSSYLVRHRLLQSSHAAKLPHEEVDSRTAVPAMRLTSVSRLPGRRPVLSNLQIADRPREEEILLLCCTCGEPATTSYKITRGTANRKPPTRPREPGLRRTCCSSGKSCTLVWVQCRFHAEYEANASILNAHKAEENQGRNSFFVGTQPAPVVETEPVAPQKPTRN